MRYTFLLMFALFLAACGGSGTGSQPASTTQPGAPQPEFTAEPVPTADPAATTAPVPYETPAQIDSVEVRIAESMPVQIFVNAKGTLGDGCTSLGAISQQRNNNTIDVTIKANHSGAEVCTMIAKLLDETIQLQGDFPAGDYVVRVNGVEKQFRV